MRGAATGGGPTGGGKGPDIHTRPEFEVETLGEAETGDVERKLSRIERAWNVNGVRKATILLGLVVAWQVYTVALEVEPLMFPRFSTSAGALWLSLADSDLTRRIWSCVRTLLIGNATGLALSAALPSILSGMKIGRAFSWRTLIGAELGWFIHESSQNLETAHVFAGLFTVILIGITVGNVIFRNVELRTVYRWGTQR